MADKVMVVPLVSGYELMSDSTTSWKYIDLDVPQLERMGPMLEELSVHSDTRNRTTNQVWKVVFYKSFDGRQWDGPYDLFTAVMANGYTVHAPYVTASNFGLRMKFALAVSNSSGTNLEQATVGAAIAAVLRS
jgi:hypothetical protein